MQLVTVIVQEYSRIPAPEAPAVLPEMVQLVSVAVPLAATPAPGPGTELPEMVVFIAIKVALPWEFTPPPPPTPPSLPVTAHPYSLSVP